MARIPKSPDVRIKMKSGKPPADNLIKSLRRKAQEQGTQISDEEIRQIRRIYEEIANEPDITKWVEIHLPLAEMIEKYEKRLSSTELLKDAKNPAARRERVRIVNAMVEEIFGMYQAGYKRHAISYTFGLMKHIAKEPWGQKFMAELKVGSPKERALFQLFSTPMIPIQGFGKLDMKDIEDTVIKLKNLEDNIRNIEKVLK